MSKCNFELPYITFNIFVNNCITLNFFILHATLYIVLLLSSLETFTLTLYEAFFHIFFRLNCNFSPDNVFFRFSWNFILELTLFWIIHFIFKVLHVLIAEIWILLLLSHSLTTRVNAQTHTHRARVVCLVSAKGRKWGALKMLWKWG